MCGAASSSEAPGRPVRVKFCGITREVDALAAAAAGADALGFNAWPGSKRFLDLDAAASWIAALPRGPLRVAVVVNPGPAEIARIRALGCIDCIQFHGDESPETLRAFAAEGFPFWKAVRLDPGAPLPDLRAFSTRTLLLDAYVPGRFGGTGRPADRARAREAVAAYPDLAIYLSGGLDPENVADAIRAVRPYGVDVAGGIESAPGIKDAAKMRAFVEAVAAAAGVPACGA